MPKALIFVPPFARNATFWRELCADYCMRHSYEIVRVVSGWDDVWNLLQEDEEYVVVAARRDHLPPERLPRLEIATEPETAPQPPEQRRPQRLQPRRPRRLEGP